MEQVDVLIAMVVEGCKHHFIMEWEGAAMPKGAKLGNRTLGGSRSHMLLDTEKRVAGYFIALDAADAGGKQRILVGSDHTPASNPDGTQCEPATPELKVQLAQKTAYIRHAQAQAKIKPAVAATRPLSVREASRALHRPTKSYD